MTTTDGTSRGDADKSPAALAWVVPVLAFLAGCLLSGIAVATFLSNADDDEVPVGAAAPPSASPTTSEPTVTPSPDLVVRVPQSCLDAAESALEAGQEAEELVAAVRDLDARRLQEIVDRFQQEQPVLQQSALRCREASDERIEDGVLETPAPATTPVATPTG